MRHCVDGERLWRRLAAMAEIGPIPGPGSCRQALSDEDEAGRTLFLTWCRSRGYAIRKDQIGNLFVRRAGLDHDAAPVLIGSHLDTQPTGGRFDGVLGVLAGLEILETLDDRAVRTVRPLELCVWTNEEGCRFQPAMMGSGVACGALDLGAMLLARDGAGILLGDEVRRHGYEDEAPPVLGATDCYLELHIEQGPILESAAKTIGAVTGGQGIRWYDIAVIGEETHAGPVPMKLRKDPVPILTRLMASIRKIGTVDPLARCTIGQISLSPGSINVVPGRADLTVDLRHPDETVLDAMHRRLMESVSRLRKDSKGCDLQARLTWHAPAVRFDDDLVRAVRESASARHLPAQDIVSGAGHDAFNLARRVATAMIFIPCRGGVSHNPREAIEFEHAAAGTNVLLDVALKRAAIAA